MAGTLYTPAMRAEAAAPTRAIFPGLTISNVGPAAETLRFSGLRMAIASSSLGLFKNRVARWGGWPRSATDKRSAIQGYAGEVAIDDTDRVYSRYLYQLAQRPVAIDFLSPNVPGASDFYPFFRGVVGAVRTERQYIVVSLRQDDQKLNALFPKGLLTKADHPNIHKRAVSRPIPIVYGRRTLFGNTFPARGAVECPMVDTASFPKNIVAGHICKAVPHVYIDSVLKTVATHYTLDYPVIAGRQYTRINWLSGSGVTIDSIVTADVDGITSDGTIGGTLIENAADILKHMLVNWIYGDYRKGAWFADATAPVDTTLFTAAATWMTNFIGSKMSRLISEEQRRGIDEVNQFGSDFESITPIWTNLGKIGLVLWDHTKQDAEVYPSDRIIESRHVIDGDISLAFEDEAYVPRIQTSYLQYIDENGNERFLYSAETQDATSNITAQESKQARYFPGESLGHFSAWLTDSMRIGRYRSVIPGINALLPVAFLDYELMSDLRLTWARWPNEDGTIGAGDKTWQGRMIRLLGVMPDLDAMNLRAELRDAQSATSSFWHVWKNTKRVAVTAAVPEEGVIKQNIGQFEIYTRSTVKYVDDPSGTVVKLGVDIIPVDKAGLVPETPRTNGIIRSSFASGLTGITAPAAGGGTVTADPTDLLFEDPAIPNSLLFTAGSPHTADLTARPTVDTGSYAANTRGVLSIDYKNSAADVEAYRLQRLFDNWYYRDSDQTWNAAVQNNLLPNSSIIARHKSKLIDVGANATALRLFGVALSGGTSGRLFRIYHWQFEAGRSYTTRIVTDGSAVTRGADTVKIAYDSGGKRLLPLSRFTFEWRLKPFWNGADLASGDVKMVFDLAFDANNKIQLFYYQTDGAWRFQLISAGVSYVTTVPHSPLRDTEYTVTARITSSEAELGLTPLTASVFVGTTKGTDVVFAVPSYVAAQSLYLGGITGAPATSQFDGAIISARVSPFAKPDGAIGISFPT